MIWMLVPSTILAAVVCRAIAMRKGRNWFVIMAIGLLIPIVGLLAAIAVPARSERRSARVWTAGTVTGAIGIVALTAAMVGTAIVSAAEQSHIATVNRILAGDARTSHLSVDYLNLPVMASVPFVGLSTYQGYFTVKRGSDALKGECSFATFDFNGRKVKDENYTLMIDGETMKRLSTCN